MTINDVKRAYSGYNIKLKKNVPLDTEITIADIENGTYFSKFKDNDNLSLIINGLSVIDGEVAFVSPKVNGIKIQSNDVMAPCGGDIEVVVNALYGLRAIFMNGSETTISDERQSPVVALISLEGDESFIYKKPYIVCDSINDDGENRKTTVTATYYHDRKQYKDTKVITQTQNNYSSWLTVEEPTSSIEVSVEGGRIPNKGGRAKITVIREFDRKMVKRDSCGNVSETKMEYGLLEDITDKSLITVDDKRNFRIYKDYIVAEGQLPDSSERTVVITARYGDKTGRIEVSQSEGDKTTYEYELSFEDGKEMMFLDLESSIKLKREIPIISLKKKYVGDNFVEQKNTAYLSITSDSEWIEGSAIEKNDKVYIILNVTQENLNKEIDREAEINISCINSPETHIRLIVLQQALTVVKDGYRIVVEGEGEYTSKSLDATEITMTPYAVETYEDGSEELTMLTDGYKMDLKYRSSDFQRLHPSSISTDNGKWIVNLVNATKSSIKDVVLDIIGVIKNDSGDVVYEGNKFSILVKGNEIVDYNYELCFEGHNKFYEYTWNDTNEAITIPILSVRHKIVNGMEVGVEPVPYKVSLIKDNRETFDRTFSKKITSDGLYVFPMNTSSDKVYKYEVKQQGSDKIASILLTFKTANPKKEVRLIVEAECKSITGDVWTNEGGYMMVDDEKKIPLTACWLFPMMKDRKDTVFDGKIELSFGEHLMKTYKVISFNSMSKTHKDCNIEKVINVDGDTDIVKITLAL